MKLKYYMRGLGIGILITTVVLSLGSKKEKLSDNEIMAKARELGMVMRDENSEDNLEEVIGKSKANSSKESEADNNKTDKSANIEPENEDNSNAVINPEDDVNNDEAVNPEVDDNNDLATNPVVDENNDVAVNPEEEDNNDVVVNPEEDDNNDVIVNPEEDNNSDEVVNSEEEVNSGDITFTIIRGMSSRQVSELLEQKGLIDDPVDFDNFVKQKGKASVIRVGTYTLSADASYDEILKAIAG